MNNFGDFRDLSVYKKAFEQASYIFDITVNFPKEERYSLTDKIRRSSRSVCANLAEAYRKRMYLKHYLLKISDCLGENSETLVWIEFSLKCQYITETIYNQLIKINDEMGKLLRELLKIDICHSCECRNPLNNMGLRVKPAMTKPIIRNTLNIYA